MTKHNAPKTAARARQAATGEKYTTALRLVDGETRKTDEPRDFRVIVIYG